MPLFDDALLGEFQTLTEGEMPDTVTIEHEGEESFDAQGKRSVGEGTTETTVGRISPLSSLDMESERFGQLAQMGVQVLRVPLEADIRSTDALSVEIVRLGITRRYTVEGIVPRGTFAVHQKILVKPEIPT